MAVVAEYHASHHAGGPSRVLQRAIGLAVPQPVAAAAAYLHFVQCVLQAVKLLPAGGLHGTTK